MPMIQRTSRQGFRSFSLLCNWSWPGRTLRSAWPLLIGLVFAVPSHGEITGIVTQPGGSNGDVQINEDGVFGGRTLTAGTGIVISTSASEISITSTGGGGASTLAVSSNNVIVSSPTSNINFMPPIVVALQGLTSSQITLNSSSVTLQGNTFNGAGQLVQLDSNGALSVSSATHQNVLYVSTIVWLRDGTVQVTSPTTGSGIGDNLGNHIATMTLTVGYGITATTGVFTSTITGVQIDASSITLSGRLSLSADSTTAPSIRRTSDATGLAFAGSGIYLWDSGSSIGNLTSTVSTFDSSVRVNETDTTESTTRSNIFQFWLPGTDSVTHFGNTIGRQRQDSSYVQMSYGLRDKVAGEDPYFYIEPIDDLGIRYTTGTFHLNVSTHSASKGFLGLGVSTPAANLDVAGGIRIRSLVNQGCIGTDADGDLQAGTCGGSSSSAQARVFNSSAPVISSGATIAPLLFDKEDSDTDSIHSIASNTGRLTANTSGHYAIFANVVVSTPARQETGLMSSIVLNGSTVIARQSWAQLPAPTGSSDGTTERTLTPYTEIDLNVGDYVELYVKNTSTVACTISTRAVFGMSLMTGSGGGSIAVSTSGYHVGTSTSINFIAGSNITLTASQSGSVSNLTIASTGGGGGGSPLEVFSQFDGVTSSPTLSIAVGDSLTLSASGSTATINVDLGAVADGYIPYDNGGVFGQTVAHYDDSVGTFTFTGAIAVDTPTVASGVGANRSAMRFSPDTTNPSLQLQTYSLTSTGGGLTFTDASGNDYGTLNFPAQTSGAMSVNMSSFTTGNRSIRWSVTRNTGIHTFNDRVGNSVFKIEPEVGNSSSTLSYFSQGGVNTSTQVLRGWGPGVMYVVADSSAVHTAATGVINTSTNPVDWSLLKNVPAGFADGSDGGSFDPLATFTSSSVFKTDYYSAAAGVCQSTQGCSSIQQYETATTTTVYMAVTFAKSATSYWQLAGAPLPENFVNGSTITAKVIWASTGTVGVVSWYVDAKVARDLGSMDGAWGTAVEVTDTNDAAQDLLETAESSSITVNNSPVGGDRLWLRVYRATGDSSDTWTGDARMIGVRVTYRYDSLSSRD